MYACAVNTGSTPAAHSWRMKNFPHISHGMRNALGAMLFHESLVYALKERKVYLHFGYASYKFKIQPKDADPHVPLAFKKNWLGFNENQRSYIILCWLEPALKMLPLQCGSSKNSIANNVKLRVVKEWCILLSK